MARIRSINPQAPLDEDVATMSLAARYVWAYLPCHADREGRLRDSPFALKAAIFPGDDVDMESVIAELATRRHVRRYAVDGRRFIAIRNFSRYQFPHHRENASVIPAPVEPEAGPGLSLDLPGTSLPDPENGERRTENGERRKRSSGEPGGPDSPPVLLFPCSGKPNEWPLAESQIASWVELYPAVDVLSEARKALGWVHANAAKKKTARGMPAFLARWLGRAQDRGGASQLPRAGPAARSDGNVEAIGNWLEKGTG